MTIATAWVKCRVKAAAKNGRWPSAAVWPQSASTSTAATTTSTNHLMARTKQGENDDFKLAVPELFHSGSLNKCLVEPQGTWVTSMIIAALRAGQSGDLPASSSCYGSRHNDEGSWSSSCSHQLSSGGDISAIIYTTKRTSLYLKLLSPPLFFRSCLS